jgi:hypothetical protein
MIMTLREDHAQVTGVWGPGSCALVLSMLGACCMLRGVFQTSRCLKVASQICCVRPNVPEGEIPISDSLGQFIVCKKQNSL